VKRILAGLTLAAAGLAAASLYRQWKDGQPATPRHRAPLENWENEGGAVPETATATEWSDTRAKKTPL
jgi:hypothetical protein